MASKYKAIDFFCGGGGMTCGLRQAGINVIAGVDFDQDAKETYEYNNYGSVFIQTNIKNLRSNYFERKFGIRKNDDFLILVGCSPCQFYIILSTGMAGQRELDNALDVITRYHSNIAILHCVSQYPTHPNNLNLRTITYLKKHYNKFEIGFSDHTIGISAATAAVAMGAEIIEKHVTIDRHMKGTDQLGSLGPDGVNRMIRDIRIAECWLGTEDLYIEKGVEKSKIKLERSIATRKYIPAGSIIQESDIHLLSPGDGYKWIDKKNVIGHFAKQDISANEIIYPDFIE